MAEMARDGASSDVAWDEAEVRRLVDGGELFAAIDLLTAVNRRGREVDTERELCRLRHLAGVSLLSNPPVEVRYADPVCDLPVVDSVSRLPEVTPDCLSPGLLRAAILEHGALVIRGLVDGAKAQQLARDVDRSFEARASYAVDGPDPEGFYDELEPVEGLRITERAWVAEGGGVLAVDSPRLLFDMLESFEEAGLRRVIEGYLGERPAISAQKCTLRRATPDVPGAWHQDGRFLGDVRALNVWLSLSTCGDDAPSLDVVPRRLDSFVDAGTEGTLLDYEVARSVAEDVAGEEGVVRLSFAPGDAVLFDDLFLHQTGSDPSMSDDRYSIESWFFGPSAYPPAYVPIAF